MRLSKVCQRVAALAAVSLVAACGGGGGSAGGSEAYPLLGDVQGLTGTGLTLQDGQAHEAQVASDTSSFSFQDGASYLARGVSYLVTVKTQPKGQICSVSNGSGLAGPAMPRIQLNCVNLGAATATLADDRLQWAVQTPIQLSLKTQAGTVSTGTLSCQTSDATALQVAADCTWAKALRLGTYAFNVVSSAGLAAQATVTLIPQRHALQASSQSANLFSVIQGDGSAWLWGAGAMGKLAQFSADSPLSDSAKPLSPQLSNINTPNSKGRIVALSAGAQAASSMALTEAGEVISWGGDGLTLGREASSTMNASRVLWGADNAVLTRIVQVQVGQKNAAALRDDGMVLTWGSGDLSGQGRSSSDKVNPAMVRVNDNQFLTDVVQISAGDNFTLALTATGEVYQWGSNQQMKLPSADGTISSQWVWATPVMDPETKKPLTGVVSVAAGQAHALALHSQGHVWAWGNNQYGQLGQSNTSFNTAGMEPIKVKAPSSLGGNLSNIQAISTGQHHSLALTKEGMVLSWGLSAAPQLGEGKNSADRVNNLPGYVVSPSDGGALTNIVSIAATPTNSYAIQNTGVVLSWGYNYFGALGQDVSFANLSESRIPSTVVLSTDSKALTVGDLNQFKNLTQRYR